MGAYEEAMQYIVALTQRLHEFGHGTKECELELWHRLSATMDLPRVECLLARNQVELETEYNNLSGGYMTLSTRRSLNSGADSSYLRGHCGIYKI